MKSFEDYLKEQEVEQDTKQESTEEKNSSNWIDELKQGKKLCWVGNILADVEDNIKNHNIEQTAFVEKFVEKYEKPFVTYTTTFKYAIPVKLEEIKKYIVE